MATTRHFQAFLSVARLGSFSRAAELLRLSQPAVSEQIRELEEEVGTALFERRPRRVVLTEAGRVLIPHAETVVSAMANAHQAVAELESGRVGSMLVGASTTPGIYVLPYALARFREQHPRVDVTLTLGNSRAIEERVRSAELDIGIVGGHESGPATCAAAVIEDELALIVPRSHPWAKRRSIPGAWLVREPLLRREEGSSTRALAERVLRQANVAFTPGLEFTHTEAIKQAVLAGLGVAFVSVHAVRAELGSRKLRSVRIGHLRLRRHFHVIHHAQRTLGASGQAFVQSLTTATAR